MVKLNKIYTRSGDDGSTGLGSGARVPKHDLRIAAYGTIDEANAAIGMARLHISGQMPGLDNILARIQNDLFDAGADLCIPEDKAEKSESLRIIPAQIERLENEIDALNEKLEPLKSFILPGGTPAAANLHMARTITRRAERLIAELAAKGNEHVNPLVLKYMNRLSDLLFVMSRSANNNGQDDVLWTPGQNR